MYLARKVDRWLWEPIRYMLREQAYEANQQRKYQLNRSTHDGRGILHRKPKPESKHYIGVSHIKEPFHETVRGALADGGSLVEPFKPGIRNSSMGWVKLFDRNGLYLSRFPLPTCRSWTKAGLLVEERKPGIGRIFHLAENIQ